MVIGVDAGQIVSFKKQIKGEVIMVSDSNYNSSRKVYNAMIDKRPGMIVKCAEVADVIASVNFGRGKMIC